MKDSVQQVERIPISEIRVVNPRARNKVMFQNITANIGKVGLKKPVTVSRRDIEADGTRYDLVCGQGRLEALLALGDTDVPALVIDAPAEERYLMSLVENIARRRPSNSELVREVRSLMDRGHKNTAMAEKIGVDITYINNILRLLRKGEDELIAKVEAGSIPLSVAVKIACASTSDVQKALNDAYDNGDLRGWKFRAVQALIARRFGKNYKPAEEKPRRTVSQKDLVREYEQHTEQQRSLIRRAAAVRGRLAILKASMKRLLEDDHFVTLLRAEALDKMPAALIKHLA
jgi:ParB family transcriptional regulator, chromosome partitioning protein